MSEYQYYESLAIDQALDGRQQQELRALSTRARITPTSFVNAYEWGGFKGDPRELMARTSMLSCTSPTGAPASSWCGSRRRCCERPVPDPRRLLRIDEDLLLAAPQASEPLRPIEPSGADVTQWVARLPDHEKDALLARLVSGEPHLAVELTHRFRGGRDSVGGVDGVRTVAELREAARRHARERDQLAAQRRADEQARRERAQVAARQRHPAALARRQDQAWRLERADLGADPPNRGARR